MKENNICSFKLLQVDFYSLLKLRETIEYMKPNYQFKILLEVL